MVRPVLLPLLACLLLAPVQVFAQETVKGDWHTDPEQALAHYNMGVLIAHHSLGDDFTGLLEWGSIENRAYLRCVHGRGLCLWRLGDFEGAVETFLHLLWINPTDNQGARFCLHASSQEKPWEPDLL